MSSVSIARSGAVLVTQCRQAGTILARIRGLLGKKVLPAQEALHLLPCHSIHMFFMCFPIDAVFLDKSRRVVRIYHALAPWGYTPIVRGAHSCLEMRAGVAREQGLEVGDTLVFSGD